MLRFTTAVVAYAARRSFATSAMLLASEEGEVVSHNPDGTTIAEYAAEVLALQKEQRQLLDKLAALKKRNATLEKRCEVLAAELKRLELADAYRRRFSIVAQALRMVDRDFERRFNIRSSLLSIWQLPERCDHKAASALQVFLDANEQWLPKPLWMMFFSVWRRIRSHELKYEDYDDYRFTHPCFMRSQLTRHDLKAAVDVCCGEMGCDVSAALLEVILRSLEGE